MVEFRFFRQFTLGYTFGARIFNLDQNFQYFDRLSNRRFFFVAVFAIRMNCRNSSSLSFTVIINGFAMI
jgi:hypothetical protein